MTVLEHLEADRIVRERRARRLNAMKGKRKLVDVNTWAIPTYSKLETFLEQHRIPYTFRELPKSEIRRYFVDAVNLCCARSYLLAAGIGAPAKYRILCRVSGGVTGTRESWLKDSAGEIQVFGVRGEAETEAKRLNDKMGKNGLAAFRYTVQEGAGQ